MKKIKQSHVTVTEGGCYKATLDRMVKKILAKGTSHAKKKKKKKRRGKDILGKKKWNRNKGTVKQKAACLE